MAYTINFTGVEVGTTPASITFNDRYIILDDSYFNLPDVDEYNRFIGWTNSATDSIIKRGQRVYAINPTTVLTALYSPDEAVDDNAYIFENCKIVKGEQAMGEVYAPIPSENNGTFLGWKSDRTGALYLPGQAITEGFEDDIYFSAIWQNKTDYYKTIDGWQPIKQLYKKTVNGWQLAKSISQKTEGGWR